MKMRPSQVRKIIRALERLSEEPEPIITHDASAILGKLYHSDDPSVVEYELFKTLKEEKDAQP